MSDKRITKLSDNIYLVQDERAGRFPSCNGFLLTGHETVLIDAGMRAERIKELDRLKRIDILLITHSHPDHIGNWAVLKDRTVLLPLETPDAVKDLRLLGQRFTGTAESAAIWAQWAANTFGVQPLRDPDRRYKDGEVLDVGGAELEAIHTPGHLVDHYCFFERKSGILFTTDIDLTRFGPWYGNPESDIELFEASVRNVMSLPYKVVCSSHRPPIEGDATRYFESFLAKFKRHRNLVLEMCKTPSSLDAMSDASPIYGNSFQYEPTQKIFERAMILKNLNLLVRDGLVEKSNGRFLARSIPSV